ncbi:efflux transporter outer membrane subunit [Kordiimonas sp. SCSIO 12610]|uniref:efflux transporter outer membrane subunit n=1 Tax=Kordiimonas sp. SCSIO 12610 TaxID=2829597 RepID=UPI00210905B5|nr:efflux transporter outer membrane subunit [Kordiimonas sp. SCSIO 12610]UTW55650.1 efflux transporter outer membrane subunit [Kordiimonas sp. SCSIO 12610]
MMKIFKTTTMIVASALLLGACATEPGGFEANQIANSQITDTPDYWEAVAAQAGPVKNGWLNTFNDPTLTKLVVEAQANNRNLRAASAEVEQAWAFARLAGAELSPQVGLGVSGSSIGVIDGQSFENARIGLQASWELDVWGRIRSGQQAASASAEAAVADHRFAQMSLAAAVARAYFIAVEAERQRQVADAIVKSLKETDELVKFRSENGLASEQDLALSRANLANARDTVVSIDAAKRNALRALEVLIGRYPSAEIELKSTLPDVPGAPPAGIPSEILERRPDLLAAERRIAASIDNVDQAKAARLPRISLSSNLGGSTSDLNGLLSPSNFFWTAAANLLVPVIDGGALKTQVDISKAEQKAAVETYAQAALRAFQEVETALDSGVTLRKRRKLVEEAKTQSEKALSLTMLQYQVGETDLLTVLQIQNRVFQAQSNALSVNRLQLEQFVDLNLALGGDWN